MNKDQREALNTGYQIAFDVDARQHEFDFFVVLSTRNIASESPFERRRRRLASLSCGTSNSSIISCEGTPNWKKHFDRESNSSHPRAKQRKMPTALGRHYSYWTAQELYDTHVPRFLRQVAKANQAPIRYGLWIEYGVLYHRPHANIALGGVKDLSIPTLTNIWKGMNGGRSVIRRFDQKLDTGYLYKRIGRGPAEATAREKDLLWMANYWPKAPRQQLQGGRMNGNSASLN